MPNRSHELRHTCATLLLSRNVNPELVSEMLGRATIAINNLRHLLLRPPNMQNGEQQRNIAFLEDPPVPCTQRCAI